MHETHEKHEKALVFELGFGLQYSVQSTDITVFGRKPMGSLPRSFPLRNLQLQTTHCAFATAVLGRQTTRRCLKLTSHKSDGKMSTRDSHDDIKIHANIENGMKWAKEPLK